MNVETPITGCCFNNKYATPLTRDEIEEKYLFLHYFLNWLVFWEGITEASGKLTKKIFYTFKHTTTAIMQITDYCISELISTY